MNFFDQCDEIINEVKFSAKRHAKVSDLLASLASKKVGSTFKLLKGEIFGEMKFVKSDGITGVGNVYVNNNGQYLRIGLADKKKLKDLNSFDFWEQGPITNNPTRSAIAFSHYNIIDTVNIVLEYILTGKELEESLREGALTKKSKMWQYAVHLGVPEKTIIGLSGKSYDLRKHLETIENYSKEEYVGFKRTSTEEKSDTNKRLSKKEKELEDRPYADPEVLFDDIEQLTKVVAAKAQNSMIIAGMPGLGKTWHVEQTLLDLYGSPKGPDARWRHYKGSRLTVFGLYNALYRNRNDMVIVFDDSDSVWSDKDSVNILKSALDTYPIRTLSWTSKATQNVQQMTKDERDSYELMVDTDTEGDTKLPNEFEFTSSVIFLSNFPPKKIDAAVRSRSLFVDVYLRRIDIVNRIKSILKITHMEVPWEIKERIIDALANSNKELTIRAVQASIALVNTLGENSDWQRMANLYA
jgi:hypothetical protein